jgi:hypothetical protein
MNNRVTTPAPTRARGDRDAVLCVRHEVVDAQGGLGGVEEVEAGEGHGHDVVGEAAIGLDRCLPLDQDAPSSEDCDDWGSNTTGTWGERDGICSAYRVPSLSSLSTPLTSALDICFFLYIVYLK